MNKERYVIRDGAGAFFKEVPLPQEFAWMVLNKIVRHLVVLDRPQSVLKFESTA